MWMREFRRSFYALRNKRLPSSVHTLTASVVQNEKEGGPELCSFKQSRDECPAGTCNTDREAGNNIIGSTSDVCVDHKPLYCITRRLEH